MLRRMTQPLLDWYGTRGEGRKPDVAGEPVPVCADAGELFVSEPIEVPAEPDADGGVVGGSLSSSEDTPSRAPADVACEAWFPDGAFDPGSVPPHLLREQLVGRILTMNPTADAAFLEQFSTERLCAYHDRLTRARRPRGRDSRWMRVPETRAVTMHERVH